jgi:C4-dicarboxylate-specific signal transduction histidine kinase
MQQSYAKVAGVSESILIASLIEDCLRMNAATLQRHKIQIEKDFEPEVAVNIEKQKVLQILINLVRNAQQACDDSGKEEKRVKLAVKRLTEKVQIVVRDNGVGIPAENLTRIFAHGFTTRRNGHGFGLHSGALAAREMGGALRAESAGPGLGATFTLELPINN